MIRTLKKISNIVCAYGNISNFLKVYFNYVSNFPQLNASNKVGAQSRHTFQLRDPSAHNQSIRAKLSFPRIFKTTFNLELKRCREKKKEKKKIKLELKRGREKKKGKKKEEKKKRPNQLLRVTSKSIIRKAFLQL